MNGDTLRIIAVRSLRGFGDGVVSVLFASYFSSLGYSGEGVGWLATVTLVGSAALTLAVGLWAHRFSRRTLLLAAAATMALTGAGFSLTTNFWLLMAVALVGTLNPSSGDVSFFLPIETAALADHNAPSERAAVYAKWNVWASVAGALGALLCGWSFLAPRNQVWGFELYAALGVVSFVIYLGLSRDRPTHAPETHRPLSTSRAVVLKLTLLFCLDSAGGGLVLDSLLALWLYRRFGFSVEQAGAVFFATRTLAAFSQFVSVWLAARIGLVRTMVLTHLPANAFLVVAAFMPSASLAVAMVLARYAFTKMDIPARQALVMAVVPPEERAAAASVTNVPRSLAAAATPVLAGALLDYSTFGWPLVIAGCSKIAYDILLWRGFGDFEKRENTKQL